MNTNNRSINSATLDRTGFAIGSDYAFYGLTPTTEHLSVLQGFNCSTFKGTSIKPSVFIRKWLNLRIHAFERGIHFSENLTADILKKMWEKSKGRCPYTRVKLTMGSLTGSDWSIDRLCNQYGYVPLNISVMSTEFNHAKGRLSTLEVQANLIENPKYKGFPSSAWHKLWESMKDVAELIEQCTKNVNQIDPMLGNPKQVLSYLIEGYLTINDDLVSESRLVSLILFTAHTDKRLLKRLHGLLVKITLKSKKSQSENLQFILHRSKGLLREFNQVCEKIDITIITEDYKDQLNRLSVCSEEAISTQKYMGNIPKEEAYPMLRYA
jgi:hypothetical protein